MKTNTITKFITNEKTDKKSSTLDSIFKQMNEKMKKLSEQRKIYESNLDKKPEINDNILNSFNERIKSLPLFQKNSSAFNHFSYKSKIIPSSNYTRYSDQLFSKYYKIDDL